MPPTPIVFTVHGAVALLHENYIEFPLKRADGYISYPVSCSIDSLVHQKVQDAFFALELASPSVYEE